MTPAEKARHIISSNRYMTLATSFQGETWIAPLPYVVDEQYVLYWFSALEAKHSQHINGNPSVAVAIFNSTEPSDTVDGLQMIGIATGVGLVDLPSVADHYWHSSFPDSKVRARWQRPNDDFRDSAPQRFYKFEPRKVFKVDPDSTKIDRRLLVDLTAV